MKPKHIIILAGVFLLNSCIVKSLNPFYTEDKIISDVRLEGHWVSKNGQWKIESFKDVINEYEKEEQNLSVEDEIIFERYKKSYAVEYTNKGKPATFIATAFYVDDFIFLDFSPVEYEAEDLNSLASQHLLSTHSVCLAEFNEDNSLQLKWLDEDVIGRLIENHSLKIKYEKIGYDDDFVLTAKSRELYRFLQKFMKSDIENKWEKDQIYTLAPLDE